MSMSRIKRLAVNCQNAVICHHRKLQNHLIHFCLTVTAHSINFVFHGIQHGNYLLRCIFFWQIISWSVIKQIAQQNQALCPFFLKSIQHFPAIVSRTMDVRSKHIFHKLGFSSVFSVRIVSLLFGLHNLMKRTFFFFTLSCLDGNYKIVLF